MGVTLFHLTAGPPPPGAAPRVTATARIFQRDALNLRLQCSGDFPLFRSRSNRPLAPRGFSPHTQARSLSRAACEFRRIWRALAGDLARAFWGVGNPSPEHSDALVEGKAAQHAREKSSTAIGAKVDRKSTRLNSSHLGISYAVF